jgi:hypothetical protein
MTEALATYENAEAGVAARVYPGGNGFNVQFIDTDADESIAHICGISSFEAACLRASLLAEGRA